jgi:GTP-binding protein
VFASKFAVDHHSDFDLRTMFRSEEVAGDDELARMRPRCSYHGTKPFVQPSGSVTALPEVAFLGRSNVGKSSLINALTGRNFQRVGKQPGRTQHPHYLECRPCRGSSDNPIGYLMDLPGYGYAVGPEEAVDAWQRRTQQVLLQRRDVGALRRVYLLVDARHGATTLDLSVMSWLEEGELPFTAVMTKGDAAAPTYVVKHANHICMRYHHEASVARDAASVMISPFVHVTSAKNRAGLVELWSSVLRDFRDE